MIKLRLTSAQQSALECAGLDSLGRLYLCWVQSRSELHFEVWNVEELVGAIVDAANSEDASVERFVATAAYADAAKARGAARALTNLADRVASYHNPTNSGKPHKDPLIAVMDSNPCACGHHVLSHRRDHDDPDPPYPCTRCDCTDFRRTR